MLAWVHEKLSEKGTVIPTEYDVVKMPTTAELHNFIVLRMLNSRIIRLVGKFEGAIKFVDMMHDMAKTLQPKQVCFEQLCENHFYKDKTGDTTFDISWIEFPGCRTKYSNIERIK